ncbi:MAG: oxygen-dependent protoporphyrinogen oxidase [Watsoniomyces obsoletus]|nr:MAG: oxygen-dependent protoporphyrinogen oxidase [Watsoniomyces obsoletus]
MKVSKLERHLSRFLCDLPRAHKNRYTPEARAHLLETLFWSLAADQYQHLRLFFPHGPPVKGGEWKLRDAQGATEGAEYTEAARGKPCGHILKAGDMIYKCRTCSTDDTCVLCSKCFDASDHTNHQVLVSMSPGNTGCCDCGDEEAWKVPVKCAIHTPLPDSARGNAMDAEGATGLPMELQESIRITIARVFDYICDVFSCSPEQLRLPKSVSSVEADERNSRLKSKYYDSGDGEEESPEYAMLLWNDEKHTIPEVQQQVNRACKKPNDFGWQRAHETNDIGRSIIEYDTDLPALLAKSQTIEQIKITVTIRSARDTFREQMCGTMIEWLVDIAACSVGTDHQILRQTVCEEMLKAWRTGSEASNAIVGSAGLDDQSKDEQEQVRLHLALPVTAGLANAPPEADEDDDPDGLSDEEVMMDAGDEMDLEGQLLRTDADGDLNMGDLDEAADETEVAEATYAGYPPPPPPPPAPVPQPAQMVNLGAAASLADPLVLGADGDVEPDRQRSEAVMGVPRTPANRWAKPDHPRPASYWLEKPSNFYGTGQSVPLEEDLWRRVRLDWLLSFDLRLWKKTRIDLRDLYITTVVTIPKFKRILGLRFAGLYTTLAQLYLVADREPEHSIIILSVQMLATPSITDELVERANFLTNLLAILYTFITTRQVGYPRDVNPLATLAFSAGSLTNRRMFHFFVDLRLLFSIERVQQKILKEPRYLAQFLDFVKLHQGICPNVRAVGEHVEYETDAWIGASFITRELNRLCRLFAESFRWSPGRSTLDVSRAVHVAAYAAVQNSLGLERTRFSQAEIKEEIKFHTVGDYEMDIDEQGRDRSYRVVRFSVEKQPISFHHALHYTLSWLIECVKGMPRDRVRDLMLFTGQDAKRRTGSRSPFLAKLDGDDLLMALFDYPLRVCVWIAQMRAGMWVRNGLSLRHQMTTYRGVSQRDVAYYRDIFMMQTAMVICEPSRVLMSMIDRFRMHGWCQGLFDIKHSGFVDSQQMIDVAEDFLHLLVIMLSDRLALIPHEEEPHAEALAVKREVAHILCFKPLPFSDLNNRLSDKLADMEEFPSILEAMTIYRPPEGVSDSGMFELRPEYLTEIDPYIAQYNKNQREESENIVRAHLVKTTGVAGDDIVIEPKLRPIRTGVFADLAAFTRSPVFVQIIYFSLRYPLGMQAPVHPTPPSTRVEAFLQTVLHLCLIAIAEDRGPPDSSDRSSSFIDLALTKQALGMDPPTANIVGVLSSLLALDECRACHPKIRLVLRRMQEKRPDAFAAILAASVGEDFADRLDTGPTKQAASSEVQRKKQLALDRQARVMAQFQQQQKNFLEQQGHIEWGDDDSSDPDNTSDTPTEERKKLWRYPAGTCILCQEETNDNRLYGTFALIGESNILRTTDTTDVDFVAEALSLPASLDRSAETVRPFGVAGRNRETIRKLDANGQEVVTERKGFGKGFPGNQVISGPVTTGCGHIMHYACFELYSQATQRRHNHNIARAHPERLEKKEFVCPLCKALGNMFLPIIWKGKEEMYPGVLETEHDFGDWLATHVGPSISRLEKASEKSSEIQIALRYQERFRNKAVEAVLDHPTAGADPLVTTPGSGLASLVSLPPITSPLSLVTPESMDLYKSYRRLRVTLKNNGISTRYTEPPEALDPTDTAHNTDLVFTDSLARSLAFSISAVEIALRGVQSEPGTSLIDKIPQQSLTTLRVLSETIGAYLAMGVGRFRGVNKTISEIRDTQKRQLQQLFVGHQAIFDLDTLAGRLAKYEPLLGNDMFVFLTECAVYLVPASHLDIPHILRLCYLAEIVKVLLNFVGNEELVRAASRQIGSNSGHDQNDGRPLSDEHLKLFHSFVRRIAQLRDDSFAISHKSHTRITMSKTPTETTPLLRKLVDNYALTFLRKAAVLMYIRYGVDYPNSGFTEMDEPEMVRLSRALRLPSVDELLASFLHLHVDPAAKFLQPCVTGWIIHWTTSNSRNNGSSSEGIPLSHPGIFELVALPEKFDVLSEEAMKRRCPETGKELSEPSICLFCGEIFCGQALCCTKHEGSRTIGGCNRHVKKCGIHVGLFLNLRKCTVLYLFDGRGSWHPAPYLDKHGETDMGLRRNRQLYLSQRRYDALLRNVWLQHSIPSTIARRLEADVNNGGWETI